jgi:hypothetical protein
MTQTNKMIRPEHVGDYGNFLTIRYVYDVMKISGDNAIHYKSFKNDNNPEKNVEVLQSLAKLGYLLLINYDTEKHLVHKTYKSYIIVGDKISHYFCTKFKNHKSVNDLLADFEKVIDKSDNVYFLIANNYSMEKIPLTLPNFELFEENYNINFSIDELKEKLSLNRSGLMTFMGDPGTGKSYLIKHLIKNVNKEFIYVTQDMVQFLFEPKNIGFVLKNLKDSVLILEDSENLFADRKKQSNTTISTILNLCDGIMGDLFRIKIIATINVKENIDSALFRKGRLLAEVNFKKLSVDASNKVLERIGSNRRVDDESTLAELYNDDNNGHHDNRSQIGFQPSGSKLYIK